MATEKEIKNTKLRIRQIQRNQKASITISNGAKTDSSSTFRDLQLRKPELVHASSKLLQEKRQNRQLKTLFDQKLSLANFLHPETLLRIDQGPGKAQFRPIKIRTWGTRGRRS